MGEKPEAFPTNRLDEALGNLTGKKFDRGRVLRNTADDTSKGNNL